MLRKMLRKRKLAYLVIFLFAVVALTGCSNGMFGDSEDESYSISGTVSNYSDESLEDISVRYSESDVSSNSDSDGNWELTDLSGEGYVFARNDNYNVLPNQVTVNKDKSEEINFTAVDTIANTRTIINDLPDDQFESEEYETLGGTITHVMEVSGATNIYVQEKQFDKPGIIIRIEETDLDVSEGDEVIAKGRPSTYHGMAQILPDSSDDLKIVKENSEVPDPELVVSTDLSADNGEKYEGKLVKIENITVENINDYGDVTVTDSEGEAVVELQDDQTDWLSVGTEYDYIIGVVDYNFEEYKIRPRKTSDIKKEDSGDDTQYTTYEIYEIQGESHESPYEGENAETTGIVTGVDSTGFYMQNTNPDDNEATSEGLYVLGSGVEKGDEVTVKGEVIEYVIERDDDAFWYNEDKQLSKTSIKAEDVTVNSSGNSLPSPVIIGEDREVPRPTIDDDSFSSFDPKEDAIDFYESLEGMRVGIKDAVSVGPTSYGQTPVLPNNGKDSNEKTIYDGLSISEDDYNPQRIFFEAETIEKIDKIGDGFADSYDLGTEFNETLIGVMGYDEGKYMVYNTEEYGSNLVSQPSNSRESTNLDTTDTLQVATYNLENFYSGSSDDRTNDIADSIVNNLDSPDIIGLQEIQDNNGEEDDGTVAADESYQKLITAIEEAGGPSYEYLNIDPENNEDGGAPGANIRVGLLYNPDTINFTEKGTPDATTAVDVEGSGSDTSLTLNPGRVYPNDPAFDGARKPLAAELEYNGEKLFVIVNHLSSKGGDDPLFGNVQPPELSSEEEREEQAKVVNEFANDILDANSDANVIVLGDMNDFEFSTPVETLAGNSLTNLMKEIPKEERFTYNFEGNSQVLDHILVSNNLETDAEADAVAVNSIFAEYDPGTGIYSDHDPVVAEITGIGQ